MFLQSNRWKWILPGLLLAPGYCQAFTLNGSSALQGWNTDQLAFVVNPSDCPIPEEALNAAIDTAIGLWNSVPTSRITLLRGEAVGTSVSEATGGSSAAGPRTPVIVCDTALSTTLGSDSNSIPAATGIGATGLLLDYAYILLNAEAGKAANISRLSATKLAVVLAHEIGHALGFGHTSESAALMFYSSSAKAELSLAQDDIDAITYLYPRTESGGGKAFGCATLTVPDGEGGSGSGGGSSRPAVMQLALWMAVCAGATLLVKRGARKQALP